jgi:RND family efflux transporter MFP subunit
MQAAAAVLAALAFLAGCSSESSSAAAKEGVQRKQVKAARAQRIVFERAVGATGSLLADEEAKVSLRVAGRIKSFDVDLGSCVQEGDVLARLEPEELQARARQAEAALAQAEARLGVQSGADLKTLEIEQTATAKQAEAVLIEVRLKRERTAQLHKEGIISKADLDAAVAEYNVAEARYRGAIEEALNRRAMVVQRRSELEIARQDLKDTVLRAPFGGCVQEKTANVGEYLNESAPVVTLVRMDPLRLRLQVPERDAAAVRPGQKLNFRIEGDPATYAATVKRMSPAITREGRMVLVEAEVKYQPGLRPGSFARAEIITNPSDPGLAVPEKSIVEFAGIQKVLVAQDGKVAEKTIEVGRRKDGMVEVTFGVGEEDRIIQDPDSVNVGEAVSAAE